jgi:hypothetical protein
MFRFTGKIIIAVLVFFTACKNTSEVSLPHCPGGPVVICKTKKDYSDKVSVVLSSDKKEIVAYPGPTDVVHQKPVQLANGYFLQRMPGNAFLSLSIEEYMNVEHSYTPEQLLSYVIDKNPYKEKYECCHVLNNMDTTAVNKFIREGRLKQCVKIR